ncbi:hypothetical protein AYO21_09249 [Fonsecaea monophora]|uniref:Uncharacterized protein n=1 Tax=Fonsecaea monophora TaxID=254056 RepID=A0A177EZV9_9EURO|nr:hypothetical protein AYO21_09249 [Fonsecaea monophora]OAG36592.1 hypothetical protein AYO21_09249 [Fonsecaea monophora]
MSISLIDLKLQWNKLSKTLNFLASRISWAVRSAFQLRLSGIGLSSKGSYGDSEIPNGNNYKVQVKQAIQEHRSLRATLIEMALDRVKSSGVLRFLGTLICPLYRKTAAEGILRSTSL